MKKTIIILVLSVLALGMLNAREVGLITGSKGNVSLSRNAKKISFKIGDIVRNKDEIRTGKESFAAYKYLDGFSNIKVFSNSHVVVTATTKDKAMNKTTKVNKGSVFTKVTPGKKGSMTVSTPTTVASVKGTELYTSFTPNEGTTYIVVSGSVSIEIPKTGEKEDVDAGQTAYIDSFLKMMVRKTTEEDIAMLDAEEQAAIKGSQPSRIRIQMTDEEDNIKYIEIEY
ncbi:MAG: FecR domain-containing protein [Candidatus Cloacimonetes bacterium]|nr:FecR domain-containing protein [Candidatus Cloacimonadota bacterium]